jgi:DUF1680 family protein
MWVKNDNSLVNSLLGPSEVKTNINGKLVTLEEATDYPYGYSFTFNITTSKNKFALKIRKPEGTTKFSVSENFSEEDGFIVINKTWNGKQSVQITFFPEVIKHQDINNETYFTYGGIVLALPIADIETKTKSYPVEGFYDLSNSAKDLIVYKYIGEPVSQVPDKLKFKTVLFNPVSNQKQPVELVPMGNTILRQVTFKTALK